MIDGLGERIKDQLGITIQFVLKMNYLVTGLTRYHLEVSFLMRSGASGN
jgi:hypothetical protein